MKNTTVKITVNPDRSVQIGKELYKFVSWSGNGAIVENHKGYQVWVSIEYFPPDLRPNSQPKLF